MANATKIKIPYKPRRWSHGLHTTTKRWIALIIHRRGGKTTAAFNHLQRDALNIPNSRYAYVAPTHRQAKRIVWGMAKYYAQNCPGVKFNESELLITYQNGSEILILGASNADALRGMGLWGAFLDEYPQMSPLIFTEIITKCLADHQGYCIFGGTPKGKGHFFKIYQVASVDPDWELVYRTIDSSLEEETGETIDNLRLSLEDDRKLVKQGLMTADEFEQEWYNSFEAAIKGAVYLKEIADARQNKRIMGGLYDPTLPVFTVWDLGVSKTDAMAIGFFQRVGKELRMVDYYEVLQGSIAHCVQVLQAKKYVYAKHFAPHDINHKELTSGKTRLATAAKLGIEFEPLPRLGLEDGIDLTRAMWQRLFVDRDKCELFMDLIGQYHYDFDEKRGRLTKVPVHDFTSHAADMLRYAAMAEDDMYTDQEPPETPKSPLPPDEYVGDQDYETEHKEGMGKHPSMKDVNIGMLGHRPPPPTGMLSPYWQPVYTPSLEHQ